MSDNSGAGDGPAEPDVTDPAVEAERLRRARQARVGLLRNPNHKMPPPPRPPPLIGRSLNLRSARRPAVAPTAAMPSAGAAADPPLVAGAGGRITGIDIDRLARIAEELRPSPKGLPDGQTGPGAAVARRDPPRPEGGVTAVNGRHWGAALDELRAMLEGWGERLRRSSRGD